MNNNELKLTTQGDDFLEAFARLSNKRIIENDFEKKLSYTTANGKVAIRNVTVDNTITTLHSEFYFSQDTTVEVHFNKSRALLCLYSLNGELHHNFKNPNVPEMHLIEFRPEMLFISEKETIQFFFKKGVDYSFFLIYLPNINYLRERYKVTSFTLNHYQGFFNFLNFNEDSNKLYVGTPNLMIADYIRRLQQKKINGLCSHLFFEGIVYIILSLKIQHFTTDQARSPENECSLTKQECMAVKKVSEYILQNPEEPFSVETLCIRSGLSPCKIQEGFKMMHGRTVADFIRNVRVEKAEELISKSDMNISEIVYSIGFTSRSYFAKIFKRKYNCSPKTYQNNQRKVTVTA